MKSRDDSAGKIARLPDGQRIRIEPVYPDGYATVRIKGERKNTIAICKVSRLLPDYESATV